AMEFASSLLWFHPLAWLARSRFRLDQELACDAASLRASPRCDAGYARALLDSVPAQPIPALIPWLAEPQLKERLAMIMRIPPGAWRRRAGFIAVAALLAGGLYVAGGQTPVQAAAQTPSASAPAVVHVRLVVPPSVDAIYKHAHPPKYPAEALRKGEQGLVMLDVSVDAAGNVTGVRVDPAKTTASALLQSVSIAAAAKWKFNPGRKDGKPVGGLVQVPVNFSLKVLEPASS
ncbi:MAG: TonB family protein, partial [Rhodanobacteraceae bacterium]